MRDTDINIDTVADEATISTAAATSSTTQTALILAKPATSYQHDATVTAVVNTKNWVHDINHSYVYEAAVHTPLDYSSKLSNKLEQQVFLKREDLQPVFSFKLRGAYHCVKKLQEKHGFVGVICASAGNHAQGIAFTGKALQMAATIVMPTTTPQIKIEAVKALGGNVVLEGDVFDQANKYAISMAQQHHLQYIPPYDHPEIIVGQGTVAPEILQDLPDTEYVFAAVGGGGLMAGLAAYLREVAPHITLIAVEYNESACLAAALDAGGRVVLPEVGLFADGVAVAQIGEYPFAVMTGPKAGDTRTAVEAVITCDADEICAAIKDVFEATRSVVEPAGALALAGLKKYCALHPHLRNRKMVAIISGANMNFDRLRYITERTELGEKTEGIFAVAIPEQAGAFLAFCRLLKGRSITEFNYRYNPTGQAQVFVGVGLKYGITERQQIVANIQQADLDILDLTDDEIAKLHIRHLIGGHAALADEHLFRVAFPEKPGALLRFLENLGGSFNISLFHYRNHGAAEGLVLMGLQAQPQQLPTLHHLLTAIGYPYTEITDNAGYQRFLR